MSLAAVLAATLARAEAPVDEVRMRANDMLVPALAAEVSADGALDGTGASIRVAASIRGLPGRLPDAAWGTTDGQVALALDGAPTPERYDLRVSAWRRATQSRPLVAAQDTRLGAVSVSRDRPIGTELGALLQVLDWTGGLYLPANRRGDLDARVLVGARALGLRWRRRTAEDGATGEPPPDFVGLALGGLSGEVVYGRKLTESGVLTGHLGGRADWSIGDAAGFTALTDTEVWLGAEWTLGRGHAVQVTASTRTAEDDAERSASAPRLSVGWRGAW